MTHTTIIGRDRSHAHRLVDAAPMGAVLTVKPSRRTLPQNARMWAMISEVSAQVDWYGQKLTPDDWKTVFTAALRKERVVPGINGGFVVLGQSTSRMSKDEMGDLMEVIAAFGAAQGVQFRGEE